LFFENKKKSMKKLSLTVKRPLWELRLAGFSDAFLFSHMSKHTGRALVTMGAVQGSDGKSTEMEFVFDPSIPCDFDWDRSTMTNVLKLDVESVSIMREIEHR
jgi:hypothetical protein